MAEEFNQCHLVKRTNKNKFSIKKTNAHCKI